MPLIFLLPARRDGLGATMTGLAAAQLGITGLLAAGVAVVCLGADATALLGGAVLGAAFVTVLAWRFLGGFTGDVLGAASATGRMAALGIGRGDRVRERNDEGAVAQRPADHINGVQR